MKPKHIPENLQHRRPTPAEMHAYRHRFDEPMVPELGAKPGSVEASTLGWPPGYWPAEFDYDGVRWRYASHMMVNGELAVWHYLELNGAAELLVFND